MSPSSRESNGIEVQAEGAGPQLFSAEDYRAWIEAEMRTAVKAVLEEITPSPNWSGHLGEVMLKLYEEEENGGISQGRRWAPAVHDRLQEGADRSRPPGRDYAF